MSSYFCSKCNKAVIVINSEIIRACGECINEPIIANATASMTGQGGVTN